MKVAGLDNKEYQIAPKPAILPDDFGGRGNLARLRASSTPEADLKALAATAMRSGEYEKADRINNFIKEFDFQRSEIEKGLRRDYEDTVSTLQSSAPAGTRLQSDNPRKRPTLVPLQSLEAQADASQSSQSQKSDEKSDSESSSGSSTSSYAGDKEYKAPIKDAKYRIKTADNPNSVTAKAMQAQLDRLDQIKADDSLSPEDKKTEQEKVKDKLQDLLNQQEREEGNTPTGTGSQKTDVKPTAAGGGISDPWEGSSGSTSSDNPLPPMRKPFERSDKSDAQREREANMRALGGDWAKPQTNAAKKARELGLTHSGYGRYYDPTSGQEYENRNGELEDMGTFRRLPGMPAPVARPEEKKAKGKTFKGFTTPEPEEQEEKPTKEVKGPSDSYLEWRDGFTQQASDFNRRIGGKEKDGKILSKKGNVVGFTDKDRFYLNVVDKNGATKEWKVPEGLVMTKSGDVLDRDGNVKAHWSGDEFYLGKPKKDKDEKDKSSSTSDGSSQRSPRDKRDDEDERDVKAPSDESNAEAALENQLRNAQKRVSLIRQQMRKLFDQLKKTDNKIIKENLLKQIEALDRELGVSYIGLERLKPIAAETLGSNSKQISIMKDLFRQTEIASIEASREHGKKPEVLAVSQRMDKKTDQKAKDNWVKVSNENMKSRFAANHAKLQELDNENRDKQIERQWGQETSIFDDEFDVFDSPEDELDTVVAPEAKSSSSGKSNIRKLLSLDKFKTKKKEKVSTVDIDD
ncbi:hypothetical protein OAL32_00320 [Synechococcus sp. AH-551-G15]|nr:hypothetical protein [Synechococcus sp. AH-551-G15]